MTRYVAQGIAGTRGVIRAARSEQLTFIAASLAYYAFVSVFPLLLLAIVVVSVIGGPAFADRLAAQASRQLAPGVGDLVRDTLTGVDARGGATFVGVAVFLWSGLKVFRGLDVAFSQVYGTGQEESFPVQVRDAFVALVAVGGAVTLAVLVGAVLRTATFPFAGLLAGPALVAGLTAAFLPLYYLFPDTDVTLREVVPGAVFAAVCWALLSAGFRAYASGAGAYEGYGIVGAVLLLVTWFYFGGLVVLLGAVVNAVLAGRLDEDDIEVETADTEVTRMTRDTRDAGDEAGRTESGTAGRGPAGAGETAPGPEEASDAEIQELREQLRDLRAELREFEDNVEERTLHREEVERDLQRDLRKYVRRRVRRGHARGWGPYLVLLYGTAMTLGAFFYLGGGWAILAMVVIWLSTLGLYTLMLLVGAALGLTSLPGRLGSALGRLRG